MHDSSPCSRCIIVLVVLQRSENSAQLLIALPVEGSGIQQLVVCLVVACLIELLCKIEQLVGVGGVVALHIGDQSDQLLHGGVAVLVGVALFVQVLMGMGMLVVMGVTVGVAVSMLYTVVSMSVGVFMGVLMVMLTVMIVFKIH